MNAKECLCITWYMQYIIEIIKVLYENKGIFSILHTVCMALFTGILPHIHICYSYYGI